MSSNFLSLEINNNRIKFAQAVLDNKQIKVETLGLMENNTFFYENDLPKTIANQAKTIDDLYTKLKFKEKNFNVVLADAYCFTQIMKMPKLKEKELISAIRYQADQFIPMPLAETSLDLEIIYEDKIRSQILVMIVAAPQTLIKKVSALFDQLGLIIEAVENQTSAIARLLTTVYVPEKNTGFSLFVNFDYKTTTLYLYSHDLGLIVDLHIIELGYELFLKELQINLQTNYEKNQELLKTIGFVDNSSLHLAEIVDPSFKELIGELEKYIIFVKNKFSISEINQINLLNEVINLRLLDKKIESALSLPTRIFDLKEKIKLSNSANFYQNQLPLFISTIGGCLR